LVLRISYTEAILSPRLVPASVSPDESSISKPDSCDVVLSSIARGRKGC
jgi:hypothetical protein